MKSAVVTKAVVVGVAAALAIAIFARTSSGPSARPEISVVDAYASESTSDASALYVTLHNDGGGDHLVGATTAAASTVTIHGPDMVAETRYAVGHGQTALAPGGSHIMLEGLPAPMRAGDQIGVRLLFAKSSPIDVTVKVLSYDDVLAKVNP